MERLGDRCNPILVKEMRQAVNSRFVSTALMLLLVTELAVMIGMMMSFDASEIPNAFHGREIFKVLQGILVVMSLILIPALTAGRLASERSEVNVDLLFISSLSPREIITGKFLAAAALALLIFSACAPFMTFAYLLRGLDLQTILMVFLVDFLAVLFGTMLGILIGSVPGRLLRILLGLFGILCLCYIAMGAVGGSVLLIEAGFFAEIFDITPNMLEIWLLLAGFATLLLGVIGLLFSWSIALLTPPTANRAFPIRLYTLCFWLLATILCDSVSLIYRVEIPVLLAGVAGLALFGFQMLGSISERDKIGPRVIRRIPRPFFYRIPAFLLFSGAAGGMIFSTIGMLASVLWMRLWDILFRDIYRTGGLSIPEDLIDPELPSVMMLIAGYIYCYCMTAVGIRRLLGKTPFQPSITWLLAILLFGLGSVLPHVVYAALDEYPTHNYDYSNAIGIFLTSPISIFHIVYLGDRADISCLSMVEIFVVGWAVVITLINSGWMLKQMENFRPTVLAVRREH